MQTHKKVLLAPQRERQRAKGEEGKPRNQPLYSPLNSLLIFSLTPSRLEEINRNFYDFYYIYTLSVNDSLTNNFMNIIILNEFVQLKFIFQGKRNK